LSEADDIGDGIRRGRVDLVADLIFPPNVPVEIRALRDVEFRNCSVWLNVAALGSFSSDADSSRAADLRMFNSTPCVSGRRTCDRSISIM
jgi:hypothetical protein